MINYQNSKVTVELRQLVENGVNLWDFEYDGFYTGKDKENFENKVINHFYFDQIGQETVGRFLHMFRAKIIEIMPYYKQMYQSTLLMNKEDPFESYWLEETYTAETSGNDSNTTSINSGGSNTTNSNSSATNDESKVHKFSNTPQGSISNLETHMSEASKDTNTTEIESEDKTTSTNQSNSSSISELETSAKQTHTLTRRGNIGVQSLGDEVNKLRASFINIDMMIIDELEDLFLKIY